VCVFLGMIADLRGRKEEAVTQYTAGLKLLDGIDTDDAAVLRDRAGHLLTRFAWRFDGLHLCRPVASTFYKQVTHQWQHASTTTSCKFVRIECEQSAWATVQWGI
jgi:hypothetical protein